MGCCASWLEDKTEIQRKRTVSGEVQMKVKILLLGPGESGKSTILKQMKIIHKEGFCFADRMTRKGAVYADLINSMLMLIKGAKKILPDFINEKIDEDIQHLSLAAAHYYTDLPQSVAEVIERLWEDPIMKKAYEQRNQFQLNDSAGYFFEELDRIRARNYIPTDDDILMTRVESTGIQEVKYYYRGVMFHVYDMPGQRSQRRKWLSYFENCDAIIFICAISEYNMSIREDDVTNRIEETLCLFEMTVRCRYFTQAQIILFLNKKDLFMEKMTKSPVKDYFAKYTGDSNYEQCIGFFRKLFEDKTRGWQNENALMIHETCATDTQQVKKALAEATNHVIEMNFRKTGLA